MGDSLKKVQPGDRMVIPADTFNTFIDAARSDRQRLHNQAGRAAATAPHNCIIQIFSESIEPRERYDILGVGNVGPLFDPATYPEAFKNHPIMKGYVPGKFNHEGKFAVLLEPVTWKKMARAVISGVVPVRLNVPDTDYDYCLAEITDGEGGYLTAVRFGSAAILWRQGGTGIQWALVRIGSAPEPYAFPVELFQTGGSQGTSTTPATWTYRVRDAVHGREMATDVDPVSILHKWRRPATGPMTPADYGYVHWDMYGGFVLGWINEVAE